MLEFETRGRYFNREGDLGIAIGNIFYGTEGYLELQAWEKSGGEWQAFRKREKEPFAGTQIRGGKADCSHTCWDRKAQITLLISLQL